MAKNFVQHAKAIVDSIKGMVWITGIKVLPTGKREYANVLSSCVTKGSDGKIWLVLNAVQTEDFMAKDGTPIMAGVRTRPSHKMPLEEAKVWLQETLDGIDQAVKSLEIQTPKAAKAAATNTISDTEYQEFLEFKKWKKAAATTTATKDLPKPNTYRCKCGKVYKYQKAFDRHVAECDYK